MTKKKSKPQEKRARTPEELVKDTPGAHHYRIENDTILICAENGFIIKAVKKVQP